jgi:hypothetical protein
MTQRRIRLPGEVQGLRHCSARHMRDTITAGITGITAAPWRPPLLIAVLPLAGSCPRHTVNVFAT